MNKRISFQRPRRRRVSISLLALILASAALTSGPGRAQPVNPDMITIRGFQLDLQQLETATPAELRRAGIDPAGLAGIPQDDNIPHWRILKFEQPSNRALRRRLRTDGLRLNYYVTGGAYLEKVTLAKVRSLEQAQLLRASAPYFPEFRLPPTLRGARLHEDRAFQTAERQQIDGLLLRATAFEGEDLGAIAAVIRAAGALNVSLQEARRPGWPARILFRLDLAPAELERALREVSRIDGIQSIVEVGEAVPLNADAAAYNQSGDAANASVWNQDLSGEGQAISVIDAGIADIDHCMFVDPSVPGNLPGPGHRKILAVRDQTGSSSYDPKHATAISASAAGDHFEATGAHAQRGGAWGAGLVLINLADFATLLDPKSDLLTELSAASELAHVHSNSWHYPEGGYKDYARDFDAFMYLNEMHLVIAAGGRAGDPWSAPAISKNTLTVSAFDPDTSLVCSVYGDYPLSGRQKPDLAAVGTGFESAVPGDTDCDFAIRGCGTSNATPHVAAMAALARQYFVDGIHPGAAEPSGSLIKATLINSARNVTTVEGFPNEREGWGALTLDRTLLFGTDVEDLWIKDILNTDADALDITVPHEYPIDVVGSGQPLKITLAWNDPAGTDNTDTLINNLDLEVQAPEDGPLFLGNQFDAATGESVTGGDTDRKNTVEQVLIRSPVPGRWHVRVRAAELGVVAENVSGQGYALVITADLSSIAVPAPVRDLEVALNQRTRRDRKAD